MLRLWIMDHLLRWRGGKEILYADGEGLAGGLSFVEKINIRHKGAWKIRKTKNKAGKVSCHIESN